MQSQKNSSLKHCIKCAVLLKGENWLFYLKQRSNYICTPCFRKQDNERHRSDPEYNKKQKVRYHERRSAVICSYGDQCLQCGEDRYEALTVIGDVDLLYNNKVNPDRCVVYCYNCYFNKTCSSKDKYYIKNKTSVIEYYGGQCVKCKEDRIARLTINKPEFGTGTKLYRYLVKNKITDVDVMCYNCSKIIFYEDTIES